MVFVLSCGVNVFRGTEEYCGVEGKVDIINSTFGKALGGAAGSVLFYFFLTVVSSVVFVWLLSIYLTTFI